jgi:hypothetical protein
VVITRRTKTVSQEISSVDTLQTATRLCHCGGLGVLVHQRAYRESGIIKSRTLLSGRIDGGVLNVARWWTGQGLDLRLRTSAAHEGDSPKQARRRAPLHHRPRGVAHVTRHLMLRQCSKSARLKVILWGALADLEAGIWDLRSDHL